MRDNLGADTLNGRTGAGEYEGLKLPLFRVFYDESSLDPLSVHIPMTSLSISHLQLSSRYYNYDTSLMSQFHLLPSQPQHHTLNKGILSPSYSPFPCSPIQYVSPQIVPHLWLSPRAPIQGHIIALISCRSPSVDVSTSIPQDRPRGPCILVSSTSLMIS